MFYVDYIPPDGVLNWYLDRISIANCWQKNICSKLSINQLSLFSYLIVRNPVVCHNPYKILEN